MKQRELELGQIITPAKLRRAGPRSYPILSMTMHDGLVDQSAKFKKRIASLDTSPYKVVTRDQLVVGFPIDEGVLSFQQLYDEAIVSPAYDVWEIRQGVLADPRYLELFLRSPSALTYYKSKLRGTTARRRTIPDDVFLALKTPLPPLPEQQRIAAILDHADALRAKRHAAIAKLDSLAQSIFLDMFGDPAYNPKRWRVGQLRDIIESANYGTSRPSEANGAVPMLRMNNISYSGKLDLTELKYIDLTPSERDRYLLANGDVLFNRTNSAELVGKTAVFRSHRPMTYAGYLVRLRPNAFGHGEYISGLLNSPYGKKTLRGMCKSIVGMANINAQEVQSIPCPIPPIELQQEFANRLAGLEKSKAMQDIAIGSLESLFESLQHRAFQGTL